MNKRSANKTSRAHKNWASKRMSRFEGSKGVEFIYSLIGKIPAKEYYVAVIDKPELKRCSNHE